MRKDQRPKTKDQRLINWIRLLGGMILFIGIASVSYGERSMPTSWTQRRMKMGLLVCWLDGSGEIRLKPADTNLPESRTPNPESRFSGETLMPTAWTQRGMKIGLGQGKGNNPPTPFIKGEFWIREDCFSIQNRKSKIEKVFSGETIEDAINIALANNHALISASKTVTSAREKVWEAKTGFYPTVKLESSCTRLDEAPDMDFNGMSVTMGDETIYDAKGVLSQPLFTGGKISAGYKMALFSYESAELEFTKLKNELIEQVKGAYFGILKAQKLYEVAKESVEQVEAHLKRANDYYNVGMVAKIDVLKAEVQLATVKQNLVRAENGVKLSQATFNNLLGRSQDSSVELVDILEVIPVALDLNECIKEAHLQRPELKQIEKNLSVLEEKIKIAKAEYYPSLTLMGNYDYQKGNKPENEWEKTWSAVLMANFTLWNSGATRAKVEQAKADLEALKEQRLSLKDGIALGVRSAYLSLEEAEKNISVAQQSIGQAVENFRITEEMYKEGVATTTDVLDAQTLLTQAKTNYYQALYDYNLAYARLQKEMGRN